MFNASVNIKFVPEDLHFMTEETLEREFARHHSEMVQRREIHLTDLCAVVFKNKTRDAEFLLNTGHDVNEKLDNGRTALFIAIELKYSAMTKLLIHKGANVNATDNQGLTPLHIACYFRQVDTVKLLLQNKADVHAKSFLSTPILSAFNGPPSKPADLINLIEVLIKHGANVNDKVEQTGLRPLHYAVKENNARLVNMLIANKAEVNLSMCDIPLLIFAVDQDYTEIVKAFLKVKNLDLNHRDPFSNTALHKACLGRDEHILFGNMAMVKLLVERGFDVNARNEDGVTPLHLALACQNFALAEYLLKQDNINVNLTIQGQNVSINLALDYWNLRVRIGDQLKLAEQVTKRIIDKTDDLNRLGEKGTPLIHAAKVNAFPVVKYLLEKGASVHVKYREFNALVTALHYACEHRRNVDMVKLLLAHGAQVNDSVNGVMNQPLSRAIRTGDFAMVHLLQTHGAQIEQSCVERNMYEMKTCYNQIHIAERIKIDELLRLNLQFLKNARSNKYDEVKRNLEAGACVNVSTARCASALIYASWKQYDELVDLLLAKGADVNFKSATGYTSLHLACRCHASDVIARKLLRHGAYYNLRDDKKNKTPRRHAREGRRNNMDTLLQLVDMVFRDVITKDEEIVSNVNYLKTKYTELFDLLRFVKNSNGESLISLANRGKEKCEILRGIHDLLTDSEGGLKD